MNVRLEPDPRAAAEISRFRRIRARMTELAQGLSAEDLAAQSMPDCSPGKWHLAHTSWFFEAMLLASEPGTARSMSDTRRCSTPIMKRWASGWRGQSGG